MKLNRIINELNFLPQNSRYHGSFVTTIPFTDVVQGKRIKANVLAGIEYTWDSENGIDIRSYEALEIRPSVSIIPYFLQNAAMMAIVKKIESGAMDKIAMAHFQNVNQTGPKAAKAFMRPRRRK